MGRGDERDVNSAGAGSAAPEDSPDLPVRNPDPDEFAHRKPGRNAVVSSGPVLSGARKESRSVSVGLKRETGPLEAEARSAL
jgi:hypothetical protein